MSIRVSNIIKTYGKQNALNNVSFEIKSGEIVGLLGPNGAGKSTMMKILTCYVPPTSGEASVCGFDVLEQSLNVRKKVGYLPENNPLYLEMYVKEFLTFIAGIHKIKNKQIAVADMINITGLNVEQNKKIGSLSKGYRQRVGLAQALIHNPEVLILDEPTSGLDPNQIVEIRNLIKAIGKEKTVLLSTHIMQEVEAVCDRAIIISNGIIVADDKTSKLSNLLSDQNVVVVEFDKIVTETLLISIYPLSRAVNINNNIWELYFNSKEDPRAEIIPVAISNKLNVLSLHKKEMSIQDVFQQLTKN
jgi:ABC-2 type transport system ATP-binding protein